MTIVAAPSVKGWCPGALRPMASGDGLVVRVRARCGALSLPDLAAIAHAAAEFGNGHIDATRRGNLQLRGVTAASFPRLIDELTKRGLIDASAEAEAVRNIMVAPLCGIDRHAVDVRPVVRELEGLLASDPVLQRLPGKFGYAIDGGGLLPLESDCADVMLRAAAPDRFAVGLDTAAATTWLGTVDAGTAATAIARIGRAFVDVLAGRTRGRMRAATAEQLTAIEAAVGDLLSTEAHRLAPIPAAVSRIGHLALEADVHVVGICLPFGRVEAGQLTRLVDALRAAGASEVRLSPWRAIYAQTADADAAKTVMTAAGQAGLITSDGDPLLHVEACPGLPDCPSASLDTRAVARKLAEEITTSGCTATIHVSGCLKGCARSAAAEMTLVASGNSYLVVAGGTAASTPVGVLTPEQLRSTPRRAFEMIHKSAGSARDHG